MPDKKLTDSEIKKALEYCSNPNNTCDKCILFNAKDDSCQCASNLRLQALDLINRLQAERENYKQVAERQQKISQDRHFEIKELKAENERLKTFEDKIAEFNSHIRVENMLVFASSLEEWLEFCDNLKSEARKEFAERLLSCYEGFDETNEVILFENLVKAIEDTKREMERNSNGFCFTRILRRNT